MKRLSIGEGKYMTLKEISNDNDLLEIGRKAIEDVLVEFRDNRLSTLRNNGLVIKEYNGDNSSIIRMGPEDALRIGLKAIANHLEIKSFGKPYTDNTDK